MKSAAAALFFVALASPNLSAQTAASAPQVTASLAQFDAATIKPHDPASTSRYSNAQGFYGQPGGRLFFGGWAKMLVMFAYGLQDYQVTGGPDWAGTERFEINAVPPDGSPSHDIRINNAEPTAEQRQMLQSLLRERFGLKVHFETREGEVYLLTRGTKPLVFVAPEHPDSDPRAIVFLRGGENGMVADGEAVGTNTTTDYFAIRLSRYPNLPVLNQTGITGSWDFHLDPVDPDNHDIPTAVFSVVDRLGLKIKRNRGPIQTLVIDHIDHPSID